MQLFLLSCGLAIKRETLSQIFMMNKIPVFSFATLNTYHEKVSNF